MDKAKDALLKAGRIKAITRGRMSLDNHAWLKGQYDKGIRFSDWPKGEVIALKATHDAPAEVHVKRKPVESGKVVDDVTIFWHKDAYDAISKEPVYGQTVHTMASVCNNCKVSLVQCHCGRPTIYGDVSVTITPRR